MTSFQVQFVLPVDNPENNVRMGKVKGDLFFEVPLNYPDAHNLGLVDLIAAAELSGLVLLSTHLNKNRTSGKTVRSKDTVVNKDLDPHLDRHVKP